MPTEAVTAPSATADRATSGRSRRRLRRRRSAKRRAPVAHERNGVDRAAVDADLEVQVAAGGGAGRADRGDVLAGADLLADADVDPAVDDVGVAGADAAAVVDQDPVAV